MFELETQVSLKHLRPQYNPKLPTHRQKQFLSRPVDAHNYHFCITKTHNTRFLIYPSFHICALQELFGSPQSRKCRVCRLSKPQYKYDKIFVRQVPLNSFLVDRHTRGLLLDNRFLVLMVHEGRRNNR